MTNDELGQTLLKLARGAIAAQFGEVPRPETDVAELDLPGACFVTLSEDGGLRGCIGTLEAWRPLGEDVCANAVAAAFKDPRFPPLARDELPRIGLEVSLLTPPQPLAFASEDEALRQLRPGVDGVVFAWRGRRSTFLPQVWESLPDPRQFLAQLKLKAGLPPDFWNAEVRLSRYQVSKWKEERP